MPLLLKTSFAFEFPPGLELNYAEYSDNLQLK